MIKVYDRKIESTIIVAGARYYITPEQFFNNKICTGDKVLFKQEKENRHDKNAVEIIHINFDNNCCTKLGYIPKNIAVLLVPIYSKIKIEGEILTTYSLGETGVIIIKLEIKFLKQKGIFSFINIKKWTIAWENLSIKIKEENSQVNVLINEINIIRKYADGKIINYDKAILNLKNILHNSRFKEDLNKLLVRLEAEKIMHNEEQEKQRVEEEERQEELEKAETRKEELRLQEINSKKISQEKSEIDKDRLTYKFLLRNENLLRAKLQDDSIDDECYYNIESQLKEIKKKKEKLCKKWGVSVLPSKSIMSSINPSYDRFHRFYKRIN